MLALVTGGDRGIGYAIAKKLAENGYDVVLAALDRKRLKKAASDFEKLGVKAHWFVCDVTDDRQIKKLAKDVSRIGKLDLLINNAGVAYNKDFMENSQEEIDEMLAVNLRGLINCTKELLPLMKKGTIINISSGAGKYGFPGLAVYCATKFGVIGFTESLAREMSGKGIRVYAICPGATQTDMWDALYPGSRATYVPEDVAVEVMELIKNSKKIEPGRAIDVRKHV